MFAENPFGILLEDIQKVEVCIKKSDSEMLNLKQTEKANKYFLTDFKNKEACWIEESNTLRGTNRDNLVILNTMSDRIQELNADYEKLKLEVETKKEEFEQQVSQKEDTMKSMEVKLEMAQKHHQKTIRNYEIQNEMLQTALNKSEADKELLKNEQTHYSHLVELHTEDQERMEKHIRELESQVTKYKDENEEFCKKNIKLEKAIVELEKEKTYFENITKGSSETVKQELSRYVEKCAKMKKNIEDIEISSKKKQAEVRTQFENQLVKLSIANGANLNMSENKNDLEKILKKKILALRQEVDQLKAQVNAKNITNGSSPKVKVSGSKRKESTSKSSTTRKPARKRKR